jgi:DNA processing protein
VSGLARGVDARAHRATLASGTVAVLAGGLDRIYPAEHAALAADIARQGAVITEMPLGWEPRGRDFPRRNRIVSGLSLGTVVIEAARNSGSLITARFALDQGRDVFAVPGSPLDPRAEGTNGLLRNGATLCTSAQDVIDALAPMIGKAFTPPDLKEQADLLEPLWDEWDDGETPTVPRVERAYSFEEPVMHVLHVPRAATETGAAQRRVSALLGPTPVSIDDLVRASELTVPEVKAALLDLELAGSLERHDSGLVSKAMDAPVTP